MLDKNGVIIHILKMFLVNKSSIPGLKIIHERQIENVNANII